MKEETKCYCGHTAYCDCGPKQLWFHDGEIIGAEQESLKATNKDLYYQVEIKNDKGERLAFKQNNKWTINAPVEEILDTIMQILNK